MKKLFVTLLFAGFISFIPSSLHLSIPFSLSAQIPSNGLLGWYPFNGNANDESGNVRDGVVNSATLGVDRNGNANSAYYFNGISSFIQLPQFPEFNNTNQFSISVWVKILGNNTNTNCNLGCAQFIISRGNDFSAGHFKIGIPQNPGQTRFYGNFNQNPNAVVVTSPNLQSFPMSSWIHLTMTYNGTQLKFYENGQLVSTTNTTQYTTSNSLPVMIGKHYSPSSFPYYVNGGIDDVALYNRALSSVEVQNLYFYVPTPCQSIDNTISASIIQGQSYTLGTQTLTTAGTYTEVFTSAAGCDSTVTLTLAVEPLTCQLVKLTDQACYVTDYYGNAFYGAEDSAVYFVETNLPSDVNAQIVWYYYMGTAGGNVNTTYTDTTFTRRKVHRNDSIGYLFNVLTQTSVLFNGNTCTAMNPLENQVIFNKHRSLAYLDPNYNYHSDVGYFGFDFNHSMQDWDVGYSSSFADNGGMSLGSNVLCSYPGGNRSYNDTLTLDAGEVYTIFYYSNSSNGISESFTYGGYHVGTGLQYKCYGIIDSVKYLLSQGTTSPGMEGYEYGIPYVMFGASDLDLTTSDIDGVTEVDLYFDCTLGCNQSVSFLTDTVHVRFVYSPISLTSSIEQLSVPCPDGQAVLKAHVVGADNNRDMLTTSSYDLQWYLNGEAIPGATGVILSIDQYLPSDQVHFEYHTIYSDNYFSCSNEVFDIISPSWTPIQQITLTIIEGETYTFGSQTLTTAGTYTEVFTSAAGCDSTVTLILSVEPLLTCNITAPTTTICEGESVTLSVNTTGGAGASTQLPANLQQGLVAYYPFNGNANDESGNGNNGVVNGATLTADRFGNAESAYNFAGSGQSISTSSIQKIVSEKSFSAWVSLNDINQSGGGVVSIQSPDGQIFDSMVYNEWNSGWMFGSDYFNRSSTSTYLENLANNWVHLVFTYSDYDYKIYRNAQLIFTDSQFLANQFDLDAMILIGLRHYLPQNGYLFGEIDDVGIWERVLTPIEIQQLYTAQSYVWSTNETTPTITETPTASTTYSCTVTQGNQTCTASVDITVNPNVTNTISATIIEGETYTLGTQTLTTAGTFTEVFTSAAGCDSTVTLTLSVEPLLTCNITAPTTTLCEGESITLSVNTTGGTGASSQLPANLQQGLVAYYPFNGNANDESGNGNNPTISTILYTQDEMGNDNSAGLFTGSEFAIVPNSSSLHINGDFSIVFSIYLDANFPGSGWWNTKAIFSKDNDYPYGARIFITPEDDSLSIYFGTSMWDAAQGFGKKIHRNEVLGNWHDFAWIYTNNNGLLYLDGNLILSQASSPNWETANNLDLHIGVNGDPAGWYPYKFVGKMDNLGFWSRALSLSEVQGLTNSTTTSWSNNATTPTITVTPTQTTTYTATVTTATQTCTDSITITVNPLLIWYADADGDGFGNAASATQACDQPAGFVADNTDCNDNSNTTYPGAEEICFDQMDNNCNGTVDENCAILGCTIPNACNFDPQANTNDGSCILPQPETCNGLDDNCNGQIDEGLSVAAINAVSATTALYPVCSGNSIRPANLNNGANSAVIEGNGNDLWYSFTAQYNTFRAGLSAASGDNDVRLYTMSAGGCLELIETEHENTTGNQTLLSDQLIVGQTYYVAVHNISGAMNASAKICFNHLTGSSCDHYYSNNTGIYSSVCSSFKAQYRANAVAYTFDILSASQNNVNQNITPWSYTTTSASTVVTRLGTLLPANQGTSPMVYTLKVPVLYSLFDAAGNFENLFAQATTTCTVTLNAQPTIALRSSDRCPTNKSLNSTIAPDRTVCGAMRYDWEFTEVLPNPGTAQVVQGGNFTTVLFLSNVPGITAGKTYSVRVRPVHSSGAFGQWGSAQCLRVGAAGMMNHPGSADADPPLLSLRAGGEMNSIYAIYPNPTSTGSFVLQYNGPRSPGIHDGIDHDGHHGEGGFQYPGCHRSQRSGNRVW